MTCREVADFIGDYLAGELPAVVRANFERHLDACSNCQRYLSAYRATIELERRAFDDADAQAASAGVPEDLIQAILASRSKPIDPQ